MTGEQAPSAPLLRIVKGEPTPEEIAALVAVVVARAGAARAAVRPKPTRSPWGHPGLAARRTPRVGPGQWRASSWT